MDSLTIGVRWEGQAWEKGEMGCTHFFWMTPHASCPSESHERAGWDGRRKRLGLAGATGCPGKRRAPQAARGGTGCPGEVLSSSGLCSLIWPSKSTYMHGAKIHPYSGQPVAFARLHLRGSWGAFGWILGGL